MPRFVSVLATLSLALAMTLDLEACAKAQPHPFPTSAAAQFHASCPVGDEVCDCTWDQITIEMTYDDYQKAVETFRTDGLMDPRITRARTHCLEHHHKT